MDIHAGQIVFSYKVPLAKKVGNHDAEMMVLTHTSKLIQEMMLGEPDLTEFKIFSDSTAALTSIFNPGPPCGPTILPHLPKEYVSAILRTT